MLAVYYINSKIIVLFVCLRDWQKQIQYFVMRISHLFCSCFINMKVTIDWISRTQVTLETLRIMITNNAMTAGKLNVCEQKNDVEF